MPVAARLEVPPRNVFDDSRPALRRLEFEAALVVRCFFFAALKLEHVGGRRVGAYRELEFVFGWVRFMRVVQREAPRAALSACCRC